MNLLSSVFGVAVKARNNLYDCGVFKAWRLEGPVISIGNLRVGGTGKTPFLMLLGEMLRERGIEFDVLSRGYRRQSKGVTVVDPEGQARTFGDEPLLIARRLKVPVIVGDDRFAAGQFAEQKFGPKVHLLDDGFQHRGLARDFDIVLVTPQDIRDSLLPTGRLREPVAALSRADAVVLADDATTDGLGLQNQHVWRVQRSIALPVVASPCIAFCGIARPERFFAQLCETSTEIVATRVFRDHHTYTDADVQNLLMLRDQHRAVGFVTTEKDLLNLGELATSLQLIYTATVQMGLDHPALALDTMLAKIGKRKQQPS